MSNTLFIDQFNSLELRHNMDFESLISQLQSKVNNAILCVRDGTELLIFSSPKEFPRDLEYESQIDTKFFFRSRKTQSLYAIFGEEAAYIFNRYLFTTSPELTVAKISRVGTQKIEIAKVKYPHRATTVSTQIVC